MEDDFHSTKWMVKLGNQPDQKMLTKDFQGFWFNFRGVSLEVDVMAYHSDVPAVGSSVFHLPWLFYAVLLVGICWIDVLMSNSFFWGESDLLSGFLYQCVKIEGWNLKKVHLYIYLFLVWVVIYSRFWDMLFVSIISRIWQCITL